MSQDDGQWWYTVHDLPSAVRSMGVESDLWASGQLAPVYSEDNTTQWTRAMIWIIRYTASITITTNIQVGPIATWHSHESGGSMWAHTWHSHASHIHSNGTGDQGPADKALLGQVQPAKQQVQVTSRMQTEPPPEAHRPYRCVHWPSCKQCTIDVEIASSRSRAICNRSTTCSYQRLGALIQQQISGLCYTHHRKGQAMNKA